MMLRTTGNLVRLIVRTTLGQIRSKFDIKDDSNDIIFTVKNGSILWGFSLAFSDSGAENNILIGDIYSCCKLEGLITKIEGAGSRSDTRLYISQSVKCADEVFDAYDRSKYYSGETDELVIRLIDSVDLSRLKIPKFIYYVRYKSHGANRGELITATSSDEAYHFFRTMYKQYLEGKDYIVSSISRQGSGEEISDDY